ncbi:aminotransferase class I/II-fold pyridoxal phosphate-dependent enzyme [Sporolactobacillus inulinus]|uniref:Decarboxylase n=1 Tax=Sporolactobacillus inulinus CASD TaxID=1069536 RepID=A0A0U1QM49_9BACL|nr:aminotransferase class I/II-fold pyridoxal phosphate-dependent enzyme [Sporolactobacillus inulinus]KLI01878.1 decarboxylase [Sporolactobacillus inulinus CASD]GEB78027.1 arginine decarboxylase [Sporolactobacillus inulinus]
MDQTKTPVLDGLTNYHRTQVCSFHVPGHKDGLIFSKKARPYFSPLLSLDATEVADLDDLYHPEGILDEAQQLLTDYYGTRESLFLVGGSTVGNLTMILAACAPGDCVFVQRDSHKSVFNALKLAGVRPVFLAPAVAAESGFAQGIDPQTLEEALGRYPQATALVLTYPTYYGVAARSIGQLIARAHQAGLTVLVDEAHGAHFKLGAPVPPSSLDLGADLVVHSAHKMLPAMTMGAYLHINSNRVASAKVKTVLAMLQSSSPSYPIMASLDLARCWLATLRSDRFKRILAHRDAFVRQLQEIDGLSVEHEQPNDFLMDPFKLALRPHTRESGFAVQRKLLDAGVYPEMADPHHVLLVLGLTDEINYDAAVHRIEQVLLSCTKTIQSKEWQMPPFPECSTLMDSYRDLAALPRESVAQSEAVGRIAAEQVIPYPPGIPIVVEGERITERSLALIRYWQQAGAAFQNASTNEGRIMIYQHEGE